jgi:hypothetical protein
MSVVLNLFLTISCSYTSDQAKCYKGFLKYSINILKDLIFLLHIFLLDYNKVHSFYFK